MLDIERRILDDHHKSFLINKKYYTLYKHRSKRDIRWCENERQLQDYNRFHSTSAQEDIFANRKLLKFILEKDSTLEFHVRNNIFTDDLFLSFYKEKDYVNMNKCFNYVKNVKNCLDIAGDFLKDHPFELDIYSSNESVNNAELLILRGKLTPSRAFKAFNSYGKPLWKVLRILKYDKKLAPPDRSDLKFLCGLIIEI